MLGVFNERKAVGKLIQGLESGVFVLHGEGGLGFAEELRQIWSKIKGLLSLFYLILVCMKLLLDPFEILDHQFVEFNDLAAYLLVC